MESQKKPEDLVEEISFEVDKDDPDKYFQYLVKRQNFGKGLLFSAVAGLLYLIIWIVIVKLSGYKTGLMAVGSGALIGFSMNFFGKGISQKFGVAASGLAFIIWLLGNFFTAVLIFSKMKNINSFTLLARIDISMIFTFLKAIIGPVDFLVAAIAVFISYYIGFKRVDPGQIT